MGSRLKVQRGGWCSFLCALREAYNEEGPQALAGLWSSGRRDRRVGPLVRAIELAYPVGRVLSVAAELDERILHDGLGMASRWLLDRWVPGWRAMIPPRTAEVLASAPILIHGNHPSLLTPFLVAATALRPDLKIISASFLERLLPSYAPYSLPVTLRNDQWGEQFRRGGLPRVLVVMLLRHLEPPAPREEAKGANRRAIASAASHIRSGGAVLIAPAGWSLRRWPWHPGIGRIVQSLSREPGPAPDYLVPFREEASSDARVRALLGGGPIARLRRSLDRRPVTIRYGPPTLRSALEPLPTEVVAITRLLQDRYEGLFRRPRG